MEDQPCIRIQDPQPGKHLFFIFLENILKLVNRKCPSFSIKFMIIHLVRVM